MNTKIDIQETNTDLIADIAYEIQKDSFAVDMIWAMFFIEEHFKGRSSKLLIHEKYVISAMCTENVKNFFNTHGWHIFYITSVSKRGIEEKYYIFTRDNELDSPIWKTCNW